MRNYILFLISLFLLSSCEDFLKEEPSGNIFEDNFFKNEDDAERAIYSVYKVLNSIGLYGRYWPAIDVGTDDIGTKERSGMINFAAHSLSGDQEWFSKSGVWSSWWTGVNTSNFVISNVKEMENIDDDYRNKILAEAMCMRAFFYFNIVRTWGDVPVIDWYINNETFDFSSNLKREKIDDVYNKIIIPDLIFASEFAPDVQNNKGRATKWLARLILSEVYATRAGYYRDSETGELKKGDNSYWNLALKAAANIIDSDDCPFKMLRDKGSYTNAYARVWEESFSDESLLEVGAIAEPNSGSWLTRECWSGPYGSPFWGANTNVQPFNDGRKIIDMRFPGVATVGSYIPTPDLFHNIDKKDLRGWGIMTRYDLNDGVKGSTTYLSHPALTKYIDINVAIGKLGTSFQYADRNFVIYRYVDAMLLYAEADNELNGPTEKSISLINNIRNRAGLEDLTDDKTADKDSFREAIHYERRIELHAECKRRFDLIRWNKFKDVTRNMDTLWEMEDNLKPDGTSYMSAACQLMYVPGTPSVGCETTTEVPELFYLLPIPTKDLTKTGWKNNFGY